MKHGMKPRLLSLCLIATLLLGTSAIALEEATNQTEDVVTEAYEYTVVPGSKEWESFYKPEQKLAASYVSPDLMKRMTTEALVETVLNYPLLVDMYAYDTIEIGIQAVSTYFGGITELMTRDDAATVLQEYSTKTRARTTNTDITYFYSDTSLDYISSTDDASADTLTDGANKARYSDATVKTPAGSTVSAYYNASWSDHGTTYADTYAIDKQFLATYPSASIVAPPNPAYNCHSYAWYSQSTSNKYWIDDPSLYMTDGSYSSSGVSVGCKVFYRSENSLYNHSGITTSLTSGKPSVVTSKWGFHSLFKHNVDDCPYVNTGYNTVIGCWK